jgi:hypothetical protein
MLGIQTLIRLDPDLFGTTQILERAMAVRDLIFQSRSQIGSENTILHPQMRYTLRTILEL